MMANALTRLVGEKGEERPIDRYVRLRKDMRAWYDEVKKYGLNEKEISLIEPYYLETCGCPTTQEDLMLISMNVAGFSLKDANKARKTVAKKHLNEVPALKEHFEQGCGSKNLAEYVWKTCMAPQMSYSFARPHALAYSYVGIQVLYLATNYPRVYWNTACLISDSGGAEIEEDDEEQNIYNPFDIYLEKEEEYHNELPDYSEEEDGGIEPSYEEEDCDGYESEIIISKDGKKKKKTKSARYGKMAAAIGKMQTAGISINYPNINKSVFTFSPDANSNEILFGLRGITRVGEDLIKLIISNRPYTSLEDFLDRIKVTKPQVINLIKSGAFNEFGSREEVMSQYLNIISDQKKTLNLRNVNMLIEHNLIPREEYDLQIRVFNFNKYLKKLKVDSWFYFDNIAYTFYEKHFDLDYLVEEDYAESGFKIDATKWKKNCYDKHMDILRKFIKDNLDELLTELNHQLFNEVAEKYAAGTIEKWEMDSVSCYFTRHELWNVNDRLNNFADYFKLPSQPVVDKVINIKGKQIPMFEIQRIAGTVLDRDKNKKTVTLLTKTGVVTVKIYGQVFATYDRQVSEKTPDGKKRVLEKSAFSRGNKIVVCGVRMGDEFLAKKYKSTPHHLVEIITEVTDNGIALTRERIEQ